MAGELSFVFAYTFIFVSCVVGFTFGIWNWFSVKYLFIKIIIQVQSIDTEQKNPDEKTEQLLNSDDDPIKTMNETAKAIQEVNLI